MDRRALARSGPNPNILSPSDGLNAIKPLAKLWKDMMGVSLTETAICVPAEWAPQKAIWTAWPADPREWNGDLEASRRDVAALVRALQASNTVRLLVNGSEAVASAQAALGAAAELVPARYGDIWLRDTGPIFARDCRRPIALRFETNSWGGKYELPDDATVGDDIVRLGRRARAPLRLRARRRRHRS